MMKNKAEIIHNQCGATMLEFAISLSVFFMFLGGIVDIGLSLHRRSMLVHANKEVARLISVRLGSSGNCDEIASTINNDGQALVHDKLGFTVDSWQVAWHNQANNNSYPSFNLSLNAQAPCFFLCAVLPNGLNARSSIESSVSQAGLECPDVSL